MDGRFRSKYRLTQQFPVILSVTKQRKLKTKTILNSRRIKGNFLQTVHVELKHKN